MTDFDYYVMAQKRIASSARHRKCGSKSKRCSLPSDYLSKKEWKEKCGKMISYNINEPMPWADFKALAARSQKEYLEKLRDTYGATAVSLGEMFGVTALTVRRTASRIGIEFRKGQHMSRQKQEAWDNFIAGKETHATSGGGVVESSLPLPPALDLTECKPASVPTKMTQFSVRFEGEIDLSMIVNSLHHILGDNANGVVEIQCELA